jgi:DNA-binding SARP family transcriptional activator
VDWYEEALRVDPCAEDVYRSLMTAYDRLERSAEVVGTYQRCQVALAALRSLAPSAATQGLFKALSAR